jgi:hypothetical protein
MEKTKVKAALKEVNDYFRDKIVVGDYTVEERGERTYKLIIDGKYTFNLWIANGEDYFGCYDSSFSTNTIDVKFRVEDKLKAFKIIKKDIAETIGKEREAKEREEFKRLQKKFAQ